MKAKRVKSYDEACLLVTTMKTNDTKRSSARSKVEGQLAGNLPYSPSELKAKGQGYRSNVNFRDLEGSVHSRLSSFVDLLFDAPILVQVIVDDKRVPIHLRMLYGDIIAEEFSRMIFKWKGFFLQFAKAMRNMVAHGVGTLYWRNSRTFKFRSIRPGRVLFSENCSDDPDDYDVVMIEDELEWHQLYSYIEDKGQADSSRAMGWHTDAIFKILAEIKKLATGEGLGEAPQTSEDYELLFKAQSVYYDKETSPRAVKIAHLYSREITGTVTHSIVVTDPTLRLAVEDGIGENDKQRCYLYYKEEAFEHFNDILVNIMTDIGDEKIHSHRGYGHKIYPVSVISNRMLNTAVDGAMISATILVKSPTGAQKSLSEVLRLGPITQIDEQSEVVTGQLGGRIDGVISVRSLLQASAANNFGNQRPIAEGSSGQSYKTARQTDVETIKSNKLTATETKVFYLFADLVYEALVKRCFSKGLQGEEVTFVKEFKDRCIQRGVPKELVKLNQLIFKATRAIGYGSPEMKLALTREMLSIAPYLPEEGKRRCIREFVIARVGPENADAYMPFIDLDNIKHFSHQIARIETNMMLTGLPTTVSADDDHHHHLMEHVEATTKYIDLFTNGQLPTSAVDFTRFLSSVIEHIASHLGFIQGELNSEKRGRFEQELHRIKVVHRDMQNQARKEISEQDAERKQEQMIMEKAVSALEGKDLQIQMARLQGEMELKHQKARAEQELKLFKSMRSIELAETESRARVDAITRESVAKAGMS